jgi:hypothetical protein
LSHEGEGLRWVQAAKRSLITLGAALAGKLKPLKAPKKKNEEAVHFLSLSLNKH